MGRREREFLQRRKEILDAALKLFSEKGYSRTSMQEIAREAEFAVGTLYKFFPTKKDLYEALVLENARKIHQLMMTAFEEEETLPLLKRIVRLKWEIAEKHRSFLKLYFSELWEATFSLKGTLKGELKEMYNSYFERLVEAFKRGVEEGVFEDRSPTLYALSFEGMVNNAVIAMIEEGLEVDPREILEIFLERNLKR